MTPIPSIPLTDGRAIPQLGLGVWQIPADEAAGAVAAALAAGYRHIDTAQMYGNEKGVGEGIRASGLPREEVFVTSKLANDAHEPDAARRAFDATLAALGTDYVDLFLVHWPRAHVSDVVATWRVLEEFAADGRARSIGVSNFQVTHLDRLAAAGATVPAVDQIELHPYFRNSAVAAAARDRGIVIQAWSPLAQGQILGEPVVAEIATRVDATAAQVVLAWHLRHGHVVFPKSTSPERMRQNAAALDVELSADDMAALDGLDRGEAGRIGPHPDRFPPR